MPLPDLEQERDRKRLLPHVIQRRRQDVEKWLGSETPFPERKSEERRYELAGDYLKLFNDVLDHCRETVEAGRQLRAPQQRVRHWAAIALLRCLLSSPAAAATVLDARADRVSDFADDGENQDDVDKRAACEPDAMRLCQQYVSDIGRVRACMSHYRRYLSPACRAVFEGGAKKKARRFR
jgi:hypothetical protein